MEVTTYAYESLSNELLGYGLKYVILNDKELAREYIEKLENSKAKRGMKQFVEGHARVYKGIIEQDAEEFNAGLSFMLRNHVARMKRNGNTLEQYFAYAVLRRVYFTNFIVTISQNIESALWKKF